MVAIVTGNGLGLERGSGFVLGSGGSLGSAGFGRYGENVTINAATGNLVINRTDEVLIGLGPDNVVSRSYNSLGNMSDDNGDNWQLNAQRHVGGLTGTVNTAGSTVIRYDWDGSETLYSWDTTLSAYIGKQGSGAYDKLLFASNVWTWTDGNSRVVETYDALNGGRITASKDTDNNSLTYGYTGALLTRITTASGEYTDLSWSGNNLTQMVTTSSGGATLTRVRYTYISNRLSTVTTDLSPDDNAVTDGAKVVTTYTYDGTSGMVASISQTGGARLDITYILVGSDYRVASYTQTTASGVTSATGFSYDTVNRITTITDAQSQVTKMTYDVNGQLTRIELPPAQSGATAQNIYYTYNANGDVLTAKDGSNLVTTYQYDTNGNLTLQRDHAGNVVTRTYGASNELLTETRYGVPDPAGGLIEPDAPVTSRYAYDAENHLRFAVSAEGHVTEYVYDSYGRQTASIAYRDNAYDLSALLPTDTLSETTLTSWVSGIADLSTVKRVNTTWDFRGNVATVTSYSAATTAGAGSGAYTRVTYTYDQFGGLLTRATTGITNTEVFTYDGLGRLTSSNDLNNAATSIAYTDSQNKMVATLANGFVQTSIYNYAGALISYAESGTGFTTGTTTYKYDSLGNLRIATDATARKSYYLYDAVGRKVADIAADGAIVEYGYDASDRLVRTIRYATKLDATALASLVDASGNPTDVDLAAVRPASSTDDQWEWRIYDTADRLIEVIDGKGAATIFAYDGLSNLITTTSYSNVIAAATVATYKTTTPTTLRYPTANAAKDSVIRAFYDADGRQIGALDGAGYLSRTIYNANGEKIETIAFGKAAASTLRAAGTFDALITDVGWDAQNRYNYFAYDGRGLLRYALDANLRPTEFTYDTAGNNVGRIDYGASIGAGSSYDLAYIQGQITALSLSTNAATRKSWSVYDAAGRLTYAIDAAGGVVAFGYDAQGRAVKQTAFVTLRASSSAPTLATMDTWMATNGGNASDRVSRTVYDLAGRVAYRIDAESYVTEYRYDGEDRVTLEIRYAAAYSVDDTVTKASLAALIGTVPTSALQTSFTYDPVGRLSTSVLDTGSGRLNITTRYTYDALDRVVDRIVADGGAEASTTHYTYDAAGRIASETLADGAPEAATTSYTYDGMGHMLTRVDARGNTTTYAYDGVGNLLSVTIPTDGSNTAVTSYTYDAFGQAVTTTDPLLNVSYSFYDLLGRVYLSVDAERYATAANYTIGNQIASMTRYATAVSGVITPGSPPVVTTNAAEDATTVYQYDKLDRVTRVTDASGFAENYILNAFGDVRVTTDASLRKSYALYDLLGRKIADVAADGSIVEYGYDARDRLVKLVHYVTKVSSGTLTSLATGGPIDIGTVRPASDAGDQWEWRIYDQADRLIGTIDGEGGTTTFAYDKRSNLVRTTAYYNLVSSTTVAGYKTTTPTALPTITATATKDNVVRAIYDDVGRRVAEVAADGAIIEYGYDAGGNLVKTIRYATRLDSTALTAVANGADLASVRPAPTADDLWEWRIYDNANRLVEVIDNKGAATIFAYDKNANLIKTTAYYNVIAASTVNGYETTTPTTLQTPTANSTRDRVSRNFYDERDQLIGTLDGAGYLSQIVYNEDGQKTGTVAFANNVPSGLRASGTFAELLASVGTNSRDIHSYFAYDGRGLLRYALDANLRPTEYVYDAAGNHTATIEYGAAIGAGSDYSLAYIQGQITTLGLSTNAATRKNWSVYDAAGRLAYAIDATGGVVAFGYDAQGRVTRQTAFVTLRATTSAPTVATMDTWATTNGGNANDRVSRTVYDLAGRAAYGVDAEGYVTEYQYDGEDQVVKTIRYADPYTVDDAVTKASLAALIGTVPTSAVQESFSYDPLGRLSTSTDGLGIVTRLDYDALDRVTDRTLAYGTTDAAVTHYVYDAAGRVASEIRGYGQPEASSVGYTYDGMGNVLTRVDARGFTTSYTYDAMGRVLTTTVPLDATNSAVTYTDYDAFGNVIRIEDPRGNVGYSAYDLLNRLIWQVDPEGYATFTTYTIGNEVASVTRYANKVTGAAPAAVPTTDPDAAEDAVTSFTRDKLGRVTRVTDAMGFYENYTLNAFGDRTTVRNKLAGNTTNVFDHRGLLISETLPMNSVNSAGTVVATSVTNSFGYDARGNRTQMIEAVGLAEQRTTTYAYDKLDRLTDTTGMAVAVASGTSVGPTGSAAAVESVKYDKRGNVIETVDAAGGRTLFYYDDLDRKIDEINAVGMFSHWTYDDNGNALTARVYDSAVSLPATAGGTAPAPVNASNYRETSFTYDRANRLLTSTVASLRTGTYASSYATTVGAVTTTNYYDKAGNVTRQVDGRGNSLWFYYDKLGRKIAQVDPDNYLSYFTLDADGNVTAEERFATRLTSTVSEASNPVTLRSGVAGNASDRITNFTYDKNGRRLTEQRTGVTAWTVNTTSGALTAAATNATITYTYNGLGEVTRKTEATGNYTDYAYDTMGRQSTITSSSFVDHAGATVQRIANNYYNGINNLTRTVENTTRITTYAYDSAGRMVVMTDANGASHNYAYDVAGRLVREHRNRMNSAGVAVGWEATAYRYDALGRVIGQGMSLWSGTAWATPAEETQVAYNAHGETVGRGINATTQESFAYDAGGRVWRSTSGDGTVKLYVYDANGNATLTIASSGRALPSGYSWATITLDQAISLLTSNGTAAIGTVNVAGMVVTITKVDTRNQNVETIEPLRETTAIGTASTLVSHKRTYNAFGEVIQETDARGYVTDFTYNTMGRNIQRQQPTVSWTAENGAITNARPTETYYYDLSGRLVGVRDANDKLNTRSLLAGTGYDGEEALAVKEFHADTGVFTNGYDVFDDLRKTVNEIGKTETFTYDNLGQLTAHAHEVRLAGSVGNATGGDVQLIDTYVYDIAGNRIKHTISQVGSTIASIASYIDTTDYDAQGRVISTVDMGGNTTTYGYAWVSTIATTGLGTFGGWTKTIVNAAAKTMTEKTDYFGRLVDKIDYGTHNFDYGFDLAGRMTQRTNDAGESIAYTYYNGGQIASIASGYDSGGDYGSTVTSTYKYDAEGNRTFEGYVANGYYTDWYYGFTYPYTITHQAATVEWDALNRMTSFEDSGASGSAPVDIAWEYDLAGNIRHMAAAFHYMDAQGVVSSTESPQDYWYKYDSMNRFVTTKGVLTGARGSGVIGRSTTGQDIAYDLAGQRMRATSTVAKEIYLGEFGGSIPYSAERREEYVYTSDGYLAQVNVAEGDESTLNWTTMYAAAPTTAVQRAAYVRDAMGRVGTYSEYDYAGSSVVYSRAATYNSKSQVTADVTTSVRTDGTWVSSTSYYYFDSNGNGTGAYQGGVVTKAVSSVTKNGTAQTGSTTTNSYVWWDSAQQNVTTITGTTTNTSTFHYDDSGRLQSVYIQDGRPRTVSFVTDGVGQILQRDEADNSSGGDPRELHYYFNGIKVGDVSNNGTSDVDYVTSIAQHQATPSNTPFRNGWSVGTNYADFDQSYDPINGLTYDSTASRYTAQTGDTLDSIALQIWGDASFWYMIADANGLTGSETLVAGQSLIIPNKVHNAHNNSDTYKVYDPNEAIGDTSPTAAKPPKKPKCGSFGQILLIAVAVAVTLIALPEGAPTILEGILAGAAGSLASQAVGLATGIQHKFDFKGLALSALAGGITAGLGPGGGIFKNGLFGNVITEAGKTVVAKGAFGIALQNGILKTSLTAVASSVLTQGIATATGLQNKFSWAGVAAAGVGAAAGAFIGDKLGVIGLDAQGGRSAANIGKYALKGMADGIANAASRSLIDGSSFGDNIMSALPSVIGDTIGNLVGDQISSAMKESKIDRIINNEAVGQQQRDDPRARLYVANLLSAGVSRSVILGEFGNGNAAALLASGDPRYQRPTKSSSADATESAQPGIDTDVVYASKWTEAAIRYLDLINHWDEAYATAQKLSGAGTPDYDTSVENASLRVRAFELMSTRQVAQAESFVFRWTGAASFIYGYEVASGQEAFTGDPVDRFEQQKGMIAGMRGLLPGMPAGPASPTSGRTPVGGSRPTLSNSSPKPASTDMTISGTGRARLVGPTMAKPIVVKPIVVKPSSVRVSYGRAAAEAKGLGPRGRIIYDSPIGPVLPAAERATYPEGLAFRIDLPEHLAGPDGFTKSGQLSGTHNQLNAMTALDGRGATYTLNPTGTAGISDLRYSYANASGKQILGAKTVYDPAIYSDRAMLDISQSAGQRAFDLHLQDPTQMRFDLNQNGVNMRAYINIDPKTGAPYVGNVHPIK